MALASHRYKVGQSVQYSTNATRHFATRANFKIVRLLPENGDERQYRIKSASEPHERVAKESELDLDL